MSLTTPDWGPHIPWRVSFMPADTYGRHHWPADTCSDADLEMLRRAEQIRGARESYGDDYFPAQHSLDEGAGTKVTVSDLVARCGR